MQPPLLSPMLPIPLEMQIALPPVSARRRQECLREQEGRDDVDHHHLLPVAGICGPVGLHRVTDAGIGDEQVEWAFNPPRKARDCFGVRQVQLLDSDLERRPAPGSIGARRRSHPSRRRHIGARTRGRSRDWLR